MNGTDCMKTVTSPAKEAAANESSGILIYRGYVQNIRKQVVRNVVLPTLFPNTLNPNLVPQPRLDDVADCPRGGFQRPTIRANCVPGAS